MEQYGKIHEDIQKGRIVSAYALDRHGIASAVSKMAFGNGLGVQLETTVDKRICSHRHLVISLQRYLREKWRTLWPAIQRSEQ